MDKLEVDSNPDGLEFVGAYVADLNIDNATWMTSVPDFPIFKKEVGVDLQDVLFNGEVNAAEDPKNLRSPPPQQSVLPPVFLSFLETIPSNSLDVIQSQIKVMSPTVFDSKNADPPMSLRE